MQGLSDWVSTGAVPGEALALAVGPRNFSNGAKGRAIAKVYGYIFPLSNAKTVTGITLPTNGNVGVFAFTLIP
jgi:hypothetical protein